MRGLPGAETPISGHGFGLFWQNCKKSCARFCGRTARLACTRPGARPDVGPECWLRRIASRAARPPGSVSGISRRIVAVAMTRSCSIRREAFAHFSIKHARKKPVAATILHAEMPDRAGVSDANSVETAAKIAFAKPIIKLPEARQGPA